MAISIPGVPALLGGIGINFPVDLLVADAATLFLGFLPKQVWGIYLFGIPVIPADNAATFSYEQVATVADYPIEAGAFESYDKVQVPADARFRFSTGGSLLARQAFIAAARALIGDVNLYDIITPDAVYLGYNVVKVGYAQDNASVGLIALDVWTIQVRVAPAAVLSQVADPGSSSQVNLGVVQPLTPTLAQVSALPQMLGF